SKEIGKMLAGLILVPTPSVGTRGLWWAGLQDAEFFCPNSSRPRTRANPARIAQRARTSAARGIGVVALVSRSNTTGKVRYVTLSRAMASFPSTIRRPARGTRNGLNHRIHWGE